MLCTVQFPNRILRVLEPLRNLACGSDCQTIVSRTDEKKGTSCIGSRLPHTGFLDGFVGSTY